MTEEYIKQARSLFLAALYLVSVGMLALGLASCSNSLGVEENVRETPINNSLFPLEVGFAWTYRVTSFTEDGQELGQVHRFVDIDQVQLIEGESWYRLNISGDRSERMLLSQRDDGIYRLWPDGTILLHLPTPGHIGQKFSFPDLDRIGMHLTRRVEALDHDIHVDGRTYSCMLATDYLRDPDLPGWPYSTQNFYAPGTGLVSSKIYIPNALDEPFLFKLVEIVQFSKQ